MRRNLTYPKDGDRKLRETVKQLKSQVSRLRKENDMLRQELLNIVKPVRPRKEPRVQTEPPEKYGEDTEKMTREEWRQKFVKEFRPVLEKRLKEFQSNEEEENED